VRPSAERTRNSLGDDGFVVGRQSSLLALLQSWLQSWALLTLATSTDSRLEKKGPLTLNSSSRKRLKRDCSISEFPRAHSHDQFFSAWRCGSCFRSRAAAAPQAF
jgi:hypothetical protein